jgi:hypothetical protein
LGLTRTRASNFGPPQKGAGIVSAMSAQRSGTRSGFRALNSVRRLRHLPPLFPIRNRQLAHTVEASSDLIYVRPSYNVSGEDDRPQFFVPNAIRFLRREFQRVSSAARRSASSRAVNASGPMSCSDSKISPWPVFAASCLIFAVARVSDFISRSAARLLGIATAQTTQSELSALCD